MFDDPKKKKKEKHNRSHIHIYIYIYRVDRKAVRELTFRSRRKKKEKPQPISLISYVVRVPNNNLVSYGGTHDTHIVPNTGQTFCSRMSLLMIDLHAQVTSYKIYHKTHTHTHRLAQRRFFFLPDRVSLCYPSVNYGIGETLLEMQTHTDSIAMRARTLCEYKNNTALAANLAAMP